VPPGTRQPGAAGWFQSQEPVDDPSLPFGRRDEGPLARFLLAVWLLPLAIAIIAPLVFLLTAGDGPR